MEVLMRFMGKGPSSSQMWGFVVGALLDQFVERDIEDFDDFHTAILDFFKAVNMALPGKHYDAPLNNVEELFKRWKEAKPEERKRMITNFMSDNVNLRKIDDYMMITGIVAPPTAMIVKRIGQTLPQLQVMKAISDVVFVPTATVFALITVKLTRSFFMGKMPTS